MLHFGGLPCPAIGSARASVAGSVAKKIGVVLWSRIILRSRTVASRRINILAWMILSWSALSLGCRDASPLPDGPEPVLFTQTFSGPKPIRVVATVGMVADMVQHVGGDQVEVTSLCGPGVDPHLFKPTRDHVAKILSADLVVYAGLHLEGKLNDLLLRLSQRQPVYAVASGISPHRLIVSQPSGSAADNGENRSGEDRSDENRSAEASSTLSREEIFQSADPHVWMDVQLWSEAAAGLAECLGRLDPPHRESYLANARLYQLELQKLHAYGLQAMASIPASRRILVTSHDAFQYFGRAYDVRVEGVQGIATDSEAGLRRINELVQLLSQRRVPAVFVESSISPKNMQALLEGVRARGGTASLGGELFADAMGPIHSQAGSYIGMMGHNFDTISRGLGGSPPAGGFPAFRQPPPVQHESTEFGAMESP